jgi:hypothetical protein
MKVLGEAMKYHEKHHEFYVVGEDGFNLSIMTLSNHSSNDRLMLRTQNLKNPKHERAIQNTKQKQRLALHLVFAERDVSSSWQHRKSFISILDALSSW